MLQIKNLSIYLEINNHRILEDFTFHLANNHRAAIIGEEGNGKSTLLKLLLRFYEKSSGEILVYGHNIGDYPLKQLRDMITYIPQNSYLFEGTIRENIAYGSKKKSVTDEEIINAAKYAYADEFIRELPQGYATCLLAGGKMDCLLSAYL